MQHFKSSPVVVNSPAGGRGLISGRADVADIRIPKAGFVGVEQNSSPHKNGKTYLLNLRLQNFSTAEPVLRLCPRYLLPPWCSVPPARMITPPVLCKLGPGGHCCPHQVSTNLFFPFLAPPALEMVVSRMLRRSKISCRVFSEHVCSKKLSQFGLICHTEASASCPSLQDVKLTASLQIASSLRFSWFLFIF